MLGQACSELLVWRQILRPGACKPVEEKTEQLVMKMAAPMLKVASDEGEACSGEELKQLSVLLHKADVAFPYGQLQPLLEASAARLCEAVEISKRKAVAEVCDEINLMETDTVVEQAAKLCTFCSPPLARQQNRSWAVRRRAPRRPGCLPRLSR